MQNNFKMTKLVLSFNRHFFYIALSLCLIAIIALNFISNALIQFILISGVALAVYFMLMSTIASYLLYDHSDLYKLNTWPQKCIPAAYKNSILAHAGFDPTSKLILEKYPDMKLRVLNFFNENKLTESSIQRAHEYSSVLFPQALIASDDWQLPSHSQDVVFALSSAHELRKHKDRVSFFKEAKNVITENGRVIVMEQLRNLPNFLCFGFAAFHFFSRKTWLKSFNDADLIVAKEFSLTPFMRVFVLK